MDFRNIMEVQNGSARMCAKTHGMSKTKLYRSYRGMINRCENPNADNYSFYGARGIKVCDEWRHDFLKFHGWAYSNGYVEGLTLDRIDNDGDYCPKNCRWVSRRDQMNNTRMNRFVEYNGETHTIAEWTRILNKDIYDIYGGLRRGWSFEDIVVGKPQKLKNRGELLEYNGEAHTRSEWSRITGLSKNVITYRLNHGWGMDRVLAPINKK